MAFDPPALPGASSTGSLSMYLMNLGGDDMERMQEVANEFLAKANQRPEIGMAYTTFNTNTPVYQFNVDREKSRVSKCTCSKRIYSFTDFPRRQ